MTWNGALVYNHTGCPTSLVRLENILVFLHGCFGTFSKMDTKILEIEPTKNKYEHRHSWVIF